SAYAAPSEKSSKSTRWPKSGLTCCSVRPFAPLPVCIKDLTADIFHADVDVVVADGFVGNVALKASEGVAKLITAFMKQAFLQNTVTKLGAALVKPILARFAQRIDPRMHNGASLLGLRGVVIKSHGSADELAFANALRVAAREARIDLPNRITALWNASQRAAPEA
ncbi:MAG: hypothetical protein KKC55_07385, partial [Gammaproteobacteria bacterium]|nr:hypothetical protein [Gammaproteobacteria bacterium]